MRDQTRLPYPRGEIHYWQAEVRPINYRGYLAWLGSLRRTPFRLWAEFSNSVGTPVTEQKQERWTDWLAASIASDYMRRWALQRPGWLAAWRTYHRDVGRERHCNLPQYPWIPIWLTADGRPVVHIDGSGPSICISYLQFHNREPLWRCSYWDSWADVLWPAVVAGL